jgi:hypothetical protein
MDDRDDEARTERRSASAEAAALRLSEREPDTEEDDAPASKDAADKPERGRPSASAEAAALRWRDEHPEED